jgi:hypothetical protein
MASIGEVLDFERTEEDEAHVSEVKADPGGGANLTARHFGAPGDDSHPLPGDLVAVQESVESGSAQAVGYLDPNNEPEAGPGERRLYSRDGDGAVAAVIWLKANGTLVIQNGSGQVELAPGGDVTINGVTIDTSGNVSAPGEVTAMADAAPVGLSTHQHPTAMGPSGPPTPGT